jgi:hypothetical protein
MNKLKDELIFKEISINDKEIFNKFIKQSNYQISEMTFTNFFMWRNLYNFKFAIVNDFLCVISEGENDLYAMMPISISKKHTRLTNSIKEIVNVLKSYFNESGSKLVFKRLSVNDANLLKEIYEFDDKEMKTSLDDSDYVYESSHLIELKGKRYHSKRNHINKFKNTYKYQYEEINDKNIQYCYNILEDWCNKRDCIEHVKFKCEKKANIELLDNYNQLDCSGIIIKVDEKYEAFSIGEELNSDTAVIHIEKANTDINGLYTYINQKLCKIKFSGYKYINREQDLGIEGLRKAKMSYLPDRLIEKYTIKL